MPQLHHKGSRETPSLNKSRMGSPHWHQGHVSPGLLSVLCVLPHIRGWRKSKRSAWFLAFLEDPSILKPESRNRPGTGRKHGGQGANGSTGTESTSPQAIDRHSRRTKTPSSQITLSPRMGLRRNSWHESVPHPFNLFKPLHKFLV